MAAASGSDEHDRFAVSVEIVRPPVVAWENAGLRFGLAAASTVGSSDRDPDNRSADSEPAVVPFVPNRNDDVRSLTFAATHSAAGSEPGPASEDASP